MKKLKVSEQLAAASEAFAATGWPDGWMSLPIQVWSSSARRTLHSPGCGHRANASDVLTPLELCDDSMFCSSFDVMSVLLFDTPLRRWLEVAERLSVLPDRHGGSCQQWREVASAVAGVREVCADLVLSTPSRLELADTLDALADTADEALAASGAVNEFSPLEVWAWVLPSSLLGSSSLVAARECFTGRVPRDRDLDDLVGWREVFASCGVDRALFVSGFAAWLAADVMHSVEHGRVSAAKASVLALCDPTDVVEACAAAGVARAVDLPLPAVHDVVVLTAARDAVAVFDAAIDWVRPSGGWSWVVLGDRDARRLNVDTRLAGGRRAPGGQSAMVSRRLAKQLGVVCPMVQVFAVPARSTCEVRQFALTLWERAGGSPRSDLAQMFGDAAALMARPG